MSGWERQLRGGMDPTDEDGPRFDPRRLADQILAHRRARDLEVPGDAVDPPVADNGDADVVRQTIPKDWKER